MIPHAIMTPVELRDCDYSELDITPPDVSLSLQLHEKAHEVDHSRRNMGKHSHLAAEWTVRTREPFVYFSGCRCKFG
jgi:hypothetical protein